MNKLFFMLCLWPIGLAAQSATQPLYISNVTFFFPNACNPETANIVITASGGEPSFFGEYTYSLLNLNSQQPVGPDQFTTVAHYEYIFTVAFPGVLVTVTDSANNSATANLQFTPFASESVSFNIDSLPLQDGQGCITLSVVNPVGSIVKLGVSGAEKVLTKAPFKQTFSAFPTTPSTHLLASTKIAQDCGPTQGLSQVLISFQLPQGVADPLTTFVYNEYCSCTLNNSTLPTQ